MPLLEAIAKEKFPSCMSIRLAYYRVAFFTRVHSGGPQKVKKTGLQPGGDTRYGHFALQETLQWK